MDIKKVAVLGAGAVGSYVIWGLSARRDIELGVMADGPRGERLGDFVNDFTEDQVYKLTDVGNGPSMFYIMRNIKWQGVE